MKHLTDLKNPEEFLEDKVRVTQKIDGTALIVRMTDDGVRYYSREGKGEIDPIKRTVTNIYEDLIEHLESQDLSFLSEGDELDFEGFPDEIDPIIPIQKEPKNKLVLLNASSGDPSKIAKKIDVEPPPVIFEGKLDKKQKEILLNNQITPQTIKNYFNGTFEPLINESQMEGVVIENLSSGKAAKATDPSFTDEIKQKQNADKELKDEYFQLLTNIVVNFEISVPKDYHYTPENYLKVMFDNIRNQMDEIFQHKEKFKKFDYGAQFELKGIDFNWRRVPKKISKIMQDEPWFKDLVRMLILNHSKKRKKATKAIPKEYMKIINNKVEVLLQEQSRFSKYIAEKTIRDWILK